MASFQTKISFCLLLSAYSLLFALSLPSCKNGGVDPNLPGPDTTSHNYLWSIDTIGVFQSSLSDVWGSSATDVWAVGRITSSQSGLYPNAIHYDGNGWNEIQIEQGFDISGIYGFSTNEVIAVGTNGRVYRKGVSGWAQDICLGVGDGCVGLLGGEQLNAIWGTSSQDLFAGKRGDCTF